MSCVVMGHMFSSQATVSLSLSLSRSLSLSPSLFLFIPLLYLQYFFICFKFVWFALSPPPFLPLLSFQPPPLSLPPPSLSLFLSLSFSHYLRLLRSLIKFTLRVRFFCNKQFTAFTDSFDKVKFET